MPAYKPGTRRSLPSAKKPTKKPNLRPKPVRMGAARPGRATAGGSGFTAPKLGVNPVTTPQVPTVAATAAPAPRAPAAPVGQGFTPDSIYQNDSDAADRREKERLGELDTEERNTKFEYGIDDPTNPFSRVAGLKKAYLARAGGDITSQAARGQLYSGSTQQQLNNTRFDEEKDNAELRKSYETAIGNIGRARTQAKYDTEDTKRRAYESWFGRQPEPDYNLSEDEPASPAAAAKPKAAPTSAAAKFKAAQAKKAAAARAAEAKAKKKRKR